MDPRMIPKGGADTEYTYGEQDGTRRPNRPGVYYHPQANKFIETGGVRKPDGTIAYASEEGKIQGDAFTQLGYREATDEERAHYEGARKASVEAQRVNKSKTTFVMGR